MKSDNYLIKAYIETDYCFNTDNKEICINIGKSNQELENLLEKLNANNWIFITAYNPMSEKYSDDENKYRQNNLIKDLEELKLKYFFGEGRGHDISWSPEQSLLVIDINKKSILYLMNKYKQKAIVKGKKNKLPYLYQNIYKY